ncbi:MAG: hypothetical protein PVTTEEND_000658, partial [Candidatus Fervidibacter sp.]
RVLLGRARGRGVITEQVQGKVAGKGQRNGNALGGDVGRRFCRQVLGCLRRPQRHGDRQRHCDDGENHRPCGHGIHPFLQHSRTVSAPTFCHSPPFHASLGAHHEMPKRVRGMMAVRLRRRSEAIGMDGSDDGIGSGRMRGRFSGSTFKNATPAFR